MNERYINDSISNGNEFDEEKKYYDSVISVVDEKYNYYINEDILNRYSFNDPDASGHGVYLESQRLYNEIKKWRNIREKPYFSRIDYFSDKDHSYYIGKHEIDKLVTDWRDEKVKKYYDGDNFSNKIGNDELKLVREYVISGYMQFDGYKNRFVKGIEAEIANKYDILLNTIEGEYRNNKDIHDIIKTIEENQFKIISSDDKNNIVVFGCAGSGKTMIMLHRISYLSYDRLSYGRSSSDIFVISPTSNLNFEIGKLFAELELDKVNKFSYLELYGNLIEESLDKLGLKEKLELKEYLRNENISDQTIIATIYENDFIKAIEKDVKNILMKKDVKFIDYLEKRILVLSNEKSLEDLKENTDIVLRVLKKYGFTEFYDCRKVRSLVKEYRELLRSCDFVLAQYEKNNTISIDRKIDNEVEKGNRIYLILDTLSKLGTAYNNIFKKNGENRIDNMYFYSRKELFNGTLKERYLDIYDKILQVKDKYLENEIVDLKTEMITFTKDVIDNILYSREDIALNVDRYHYAISLVEKEKIDELLKKYENFSETDVLVQILKYLCIIDDSYFDSDYLIKEVIDYLLSEIKDRYNLNVSKKYEYELFLSVEILKIMNILVSFNNKLVCIDEFQDLSCEELELIKIIFKNSTFNYYGDLLQAINPKSVKRNELKKCIPSDVMYYKILENYRNPKDIIDYVNNTFKTEMKAIGISGFLNKGIKYDEILKIRITNNDRVVLIVKDLSLFKLKYAQSENFNYINSEYSTFDRSKINVIPISLAKGLEYEVVYLLAEGMSLNEKYVGCTRALNYLYIVK